ncbi:unnamed protein product [Malus baccata var. baccata]
MTQSSHLVREHILEFDDNFERTLRRNKNQQDRNPPIPAPEFEEYLKKKRNIPTLAADNRTIKELFASGLDNVVPLCIQYPMATLGKMDEFELKSSLLHHIPKLHGMSMEDPNKHLKEFEVVCSSMTLVNVDRSILRMKVFHFSLLDNAKDWLYELAPGTVTAWERLLPIERQMLYASEGGALVDKTPMAAKTLIANRALNAQQYEGIGQMDTPRQQVNEGARKSSQSNAKPRQKSGPNGEANWADCRVLGQFREQGKLPSSTVINRNGGFESAKAMSLRSGKQVGSDPQPSKSRSNEVEELIIKEDEQSTPTARVETPFPQAPNAFKPSNFGQQRKRISSKEVVKVSENVSAVLQRKLPTKCKDPSSFTIPCVIGELKNDGVIIQLADRSNVYPKGVLEDVLVQVNHLIFPADFYVLEMDESDHSPTLPILLGRPFMKTARTKIDVFNETLTMEFDGEVINFNLSDSNKYPIIARGMNIQNNEAVTMHPYGMNDFSPAVPPNEDVIEMVAALESLPLQSGKFLDPISISVSVNKLLPSVVQPPTLELKPLPSHLKYVFLDDDETLPIIISSTLTTQEDDKLVRVLREYKTTIGWTLADIKGISPTTCMHCKLLEEGSKTYREARRRLNPPMMEVVKKESSF